MIIKTEIIKPSNQAPVKAISILQKGGVIIYPTETCYGIGADATSNKAVLKVIKIKKRSKEKKIPIAVSDIRMARRYLIITKEAEKLVRAFMPGPLTLVVRGKKGKSMGFRIPNSKFVLRLIRKFGKPITTTSANVSGRQPIYKMKEIIKTFDGKIDLIIDAGNIPKRKPSTVFDVLTGKVLRKGPISEKDITEALRNYSHARK